MFDQEVINMLLRGIWETVYMTLGSTFLGYVIGLPMGILLTISDKDGIKPGLLITSLDEGFDICDSGLKVGDIITEIDGKPMYTMTAIKSIPNEYKPGDKVKAKVYRKDQFSNEEPTEFEIEFTFGEFGKGE